MLSVSCEFENIPTALTPKVLTHAPPPRKLFPTMQRRLSPAAEPRFPEHLPVRTPASTPPELLDLDLRAGRFDLLFDFFGFRLGHAFLDRLGSAFDKRLRFRQAKTRDCAAHFLDHADFVPAHLFQDDFERGLLFSCRRSRTSARAC